MPAELYRKLSEEAFAAGRPDVAADLLRQANRIRPPRPDEKAEALHADAIRLIQENRLSEAEPPLLRAIQLRPTVAAWHEHLGVLYARQRKFPEASSTLRVALRLDPTVSRCWQNLAQSCTDQQDHPAAEAALREAVRREPTAPDLRIALGSAIAAQRKDADALAEWRGITEQFPKYADGWTATGLAHARAKQFAEAVPYFQKAAELAPQSAEAHSNLAAALGKLKRWEECERAARAAVGINLNHASAWGNLGNCLRDLGRYEEAGPALARCLQLNPNDADAAGNFALTLATVGRHAEALQWYDRGLHLRPDDDEMRFNRSLTHLTLGDFTQGWAGYEWRWKTEMLKGKERTFPHPRWAGGDLTGKRIFLAAEQGHGDYIQFARYAKPLADRGAVVVLQPPTDLVELVRTVPGVAEVIDQPTAEAAFHTYCQIMSVPGVLKQQVTDITGEPYMTAPAEAVERWKTKLAGVPGFKVGFTWQGNPDHGGDRWRSVKLERFAGLATVPGVTLVSIQKGHGRDQLATATFPVHDVGGELTNFADTAGLLLNLDLLISIDSAVVHLAGALGTRVWTAVAFNNDWRWLRDRSDTPWYKSMTLFRQPKVHDWDSVFAALESELRKAVE